MKFAWTITFCILFACIQKMNGEFVFPETFDRERPRLMPSSVTKEAILHNIRNRPEIADSYARFKANIDEHVERHKDDPEWMVSRLQMYWNTHSTDVFIKGGVYSHAEGKAPVPTVRFNGARDFISDYAKPVLEDVKPYMDDPRGIWVQHKGTKEWGWVDQSKTGRVIEKINQEIMGLAREAALIYWLEGDENHAQFAFDLFHTYMLGLWYRNAPYDLEHGHHQTLVGLQSFQVIRERVTRSLAGCYDFLFDYLKRTAPDMMDIYRGSLVKFAEQIIRNGVPFNNWNLFQANHVIGIALALDNDGAYEDGKGCQYFLNRIFNETSVRQWSFAEMLNRGYDPNTGIWNESPSYGIAVTRDFVDVVSGIEGTMGVDILPQMPVLNKAVEVLPQYLFPNRYIVGFGDTHYTRLDNEPVMGLVKNAQVFGKRDTEEKFTALAKMLAREGSQGGRDRGRNSGFRSLLSGESIALDPDIPAARFSDFVTQTFYAPNVSWLVQRNGFDPKHGLMVSQAGSLGNHMHSNGIAMELYGKGYVLAPEGGRGSSYFSRDYLEYYSQFPAHNTVVVDGISKYAEMKSHHAFEVQSVYPASGRKTGYYPDITFSDLYFLEPETNADQNRVMSIIRTGATSGYYVDIFRSRRKAGGDRYHDYFYHNLGQELLLTDASGQALQLSPSDRLTFADGDLFAYDYIWDKQSKATDQDFKATFRLNMEGEEEILMNMWMVGEEDREVFKVLTPPSEAFRREMVPEEISRAPLPAVVVRQQGEAWTRPFAAIYEPTTESDPSVIRSLESFEAENAGEGFVGLQVVGVSGREDHVFSSGRSGNVQYDDMEFDGTYGVVTREEGGVILFLGSGRLISGGGYRLEVLGEEVGSAALSAKNGSLHLTADSAVLISFPDDFGRGRLIMSVGENRIEGRRVELGGEKSVVFELPETNWQSANIENVE